MGKANLQAQEEDQCLPGRGWRGRLQVHPELGCAVTEGKQQGPLTRARPQPGAGDASKTHVIVTLKMPLAGDRCRQVIHKVEWGTKDGGAPSRLPGENLGSLGVRGYGNYTFSNHKSNI